MFALFRHHKALLTLALLLGVIGSGLSIAAAFILERILDAVVYGDPTLFRRMSWVVVAWIGAVAVVAVTCALAEKRLIVCAIADLRADLHRGILARDAEQYRQVNSADYLSALTNDVKIIEDNMARPVLATIQYAVVFVMATVALFVYSPLIGGVMLASLVLMYVLPAALGRAIGGRQEVYSGGLSLFTLRLKDQLLGYDVIRSFRLGDAARSSFRAQNRDLATKKYAVDRLVATSESLAAVIGGGTQVGVMLLTGYLVLTGRMSAGAILAILQLAGAFVAPVGALMQNLPLIQGARPVLARLTDLAHPPASSFQGTRTPTFATDIAVTDLGFGYTPDRPVLTGVTTRFEKGRKYALVGPSGSGKSTLIRLLCAEYGTYGGAIAYDGTELHDLDIPQLLTFVAVIHQNVTMFDETIGANIGLHRTYPSETWQRALRRSGVDRFLGTTGQGLDTPVGENGALLSGGQRQRIAVARALIEDKPLLILDEGTSAVDAPTAHDIETSLLGVDALTMITITHNLVPDLLRRYDAILFMEDGRIAESGPYDALVARGGRFAAYQSIAGKEEPNVAAAAPAPGDVVPDPPGGLGQEGAQAGRR